MRVYASGRGRRAGSLAWRDRQLRPKTVTSCICASVRASPVGSPSTGWPNTCPTRPAIRAAQTMPGTEEWLDESMLVAPMLNGDRTTGVIVLSKLGLDRFSRASCVTLASTPRSPPRPWPMPTSRAPARIRTNARPAAAEPGRAPPGDRAILTNLDPGTVVDEIADSLVGLIPVDTLGIYLHEPAQTGSGRCWRGARSRGLHVRRLPEGAVVAEVLTTSEARASRGSGSRHDVPQAALIVAPLRGRERVLGVLHLKRLGEGALRDARIGPRAPVRGTRLDRTSERVGPPSGHDPGADGCDDGPEEPRHLPRRPRRSRSPLAANSPY